ncbi:MAG TPA: hemerythrin domain-containing protein [Bdellovibrionota bacterium]|nr:hemerythrin domain-containing protein [Bdellovibrionota bacterium]
MINQALLRLKSASKIVTRMEPDALDLLVSDHMKVEALLLQLRLRRDDIARTRLLRQIKADLDLHMRIEEEIFYPACREVTKLEGLVEHAYDEHEEAREIVRSLASTKPSSQKYSKCVTELIKALEHHVSEEENKLFPEVRKHMGKQEFLRMSRQMVAMHEGQKPRRKMKTAKKSSQRKAA